MTANTIPASAIVQVNPGVIGAGGLQLSLVGLVLTSSTRVPLGTVASFPSASAVSAYFGSGSTEATLASVYFAGFLNSISKPAAMLFYQYPTGSVAAYLRGGPGITLAAVQAIVTGTLSVNVNSTNYTSSALNLSSATSLSNAASLIQAAFSSPPFNVTFDSTSGAFVITSTTTGSSSTIAFATGTPAATLLLTSATGAVTSQGAVASTPAAAMTAVTAITQNFATFMTTFEPSTSDKEAFATWVNGTNDEFLYVMWTTDITLTNTVPATASAEYAIKQANDSGTMSIYAPTNQASAAAFVCGLAASIDFAATNGRQDFAFSTQTGLVADVNGQTVASNLLANGSNFIGIYGTAAQNYTFLYNGSCFGPFLWADSYVDQIWLNAALQSALLALLTSIGSLPYNAAGYALIEAACADTINQAVNAGVIRAGVTLSSVQAADVNNAAGFNISNVIQTRGWYLLVQPATPTQRAARQSPPITLFYTDGQSIQQVTMNSLEVA